ncbi:MAG: glycosyltransferase, partial [Anaerolineales bacterium]|nr:glycosyltransferase [Anaerolineales bacterium]
PIPVDEARDFIGVPDVDRMLLFVGRIEPLKGIDTLIEAIGLVRQSGVLEKHCCLCVSIIGGEPQAGPAEISTEMARLQELSSAYELGDLVTFLGKRSQDTLPYYYSAADAVIMPSHYESFGMVALEAMACGTPVIASQVGGLAYLVQDGVTGFHVPVDDPQALAERLINILEDPALQAQMSHQAAEFARQYAWAKITERMVALYNQVLAERVTSGV